MTRLNRYYFFVGIPVLSVILGAVLFFDVIKNTVESNPHPQVNYIIFSLIAIGCIQMVMHVIRINKEAQYFYQYKNRDTRNISKEEALDISERATRQYDIALLLQLIIALRGNALNSVQHAAVEAELARFAASQTRRLMVSNFLSGLMVGMGLLGTFIGLLGALAEIGNLIGSFSLGAGMSDPVAAITELVARLTAPMKAMGVAFSASLFGVLGSLIMGALMVAVKSATGDLVALVQSETSLMLDITDESVSEAKLSTLEPLTQALGNFVEQSPLMRGLAVALDQSERRVRDLTNGLVQLSAQISASQSATQTLIDKFSQNQKVLVDANARIGNLLEQHLSVFSKTQDALKSDSTGRTELVLQTHNILNELKHRNEQIVHMLSKETQTTSTT